MGNGRRLGGNLPKSLLELQQLEWDAQGTASVALNAFAATRDLLISNNPAAAFGAKGDAEKVVLDFETVISLLTDDVANILHRKPHWHILAEDVEVVDNKGDKIEGVTLTKKLLELLCFMREAFGAKDTIRVQSIGGLDKPFEPFIVVRWKVQLGKFPIHIDAKTVIHLNDQNKVNLIVIEDCFMNGVKVQSWPEVELSEELTPENLNKVEHWLNTIEDKTTVTSLPGPIARAATGLDEPFEPFIFDFAKGKVLLDAEADGSLQFVEYCARCGSGQHACIKGPAQGRCRATPWPVDDACQEGVDCSKVLHANRTAPFGLGFLRFASENCRTCIKDCLGAKIQSAQFAGMRVQAPLTIVYMLFFGNRPIRMWPIEVFFDKLSFNPYVFGGIAAGAYMSCLKMCDSDCPYAGVPFPTEWDRGLASKLDDADPTDLSFLDKFYQRGQTEEPSGGLGQMLSELKASIREIFAVPGLDDV